MTDKVEKRLDRLPPHSTEAEQGVLGCILLDPRAGLNECAGVQGEAFYDLRHRLLFDELNAMANDKASVGMDLVTMHDWLKERGQLQQIGGQGYLIELMGKTPSSANLPDYLVLVREKWARRRMLGALAEGMMAIHEGGTDTPALLDGIEARILEANRREGGTARSMPELVQDVGDLVENLHRGVGIIGGIRTRFSYFDKMTGGLHRKELAVVAARPSLGKTSWMMNIADNVSSHGIPVGIFSMEMSAEDLALRLVCTRAGIDFHKIRTGFPSKEDLVAFRETAPKIAKLPIHIDDTPALGILELRARARRMASAHKVQLFGIDYIGLMHGKENRNYDGNRAQEVGDISGGLKALAKELNGSVLCLCQLNRELERQKSRRPQLADLRESGAIEQDADLVALLYRPTPEPGEENVEAEAEFQRVNALIAKQRNGPTGDVELLFQKRLMRMVDKYRHGQLPEVGSVESVERESVEDKSMPSTEELFGKTKLKTENLK